MARVVIVLTLEHQTDLGATSGVKRHPKVLNWSIRLSGTVRGCSPLGRCATLGSLCRRVFTVSAVHSSPQGSRTMSTTVPAGASTGLTERFRAVRRRTLDLVQPLSPEDMMVQSCPEASPAKWHLAHSAWFFESFLLREFLPGYQPFHSDFIWLFNSYYQTFAAFPEKRLRSSFSRPSLDQVLGYRAYVDDALETLLESNPGPDVLARIELGANHEEQHQELLLTDILHAFYTN